MMNGQDSFGYSHEIVGNLSSCRFLKALDFDSDGDVDLIVDNRYFERIESGENSKVEERTGVKNPLHILESHHLGAVEDWDGDGDSDLLVARSDDDGLFLIEQLSDGSFREPVENPFSGFFSMQNRYTGPGRNYLADLDGDGFVNLWQMGSWDDCRYVYELVHVRLETLVEHSLSANPTNPFLDLDLQGDEVHWVDWNQDGLKDLLLSRAHCNGARAAELLWDEPRKCYTLGYEDGPAVRYFQGQEDGSLRQNLSAFEDVAGWSAAEIWGLGQN